MKKIVFLMLAACVVMMVGCKKTDEGDGPSGGNGTDTAALVKHNVELRYDGRTDEGCIHLAMDTIRKYNDDKSVDTIFLIADPYNQFSTWNTQMTQDAVNYLRDRHNVNPDKVFGKGELQLNNNSVIDNPEITRFFRDTLRYNVTMHYTK